MTSWKRRFWFWTSWNHHFFLWCILGVQRFGKIARYISWNPSLRMGLSYIMWKILKTPPVVLGKEPSWYKILHHFSTYIYIYMICLFRYRYIEFETPELLSQKWMFRKLKTHTRCFASILNPWRSRDKTRWSWNKLLLMDKILPHQGW